MALGHDGHLVSRWTIECPKHGVVAQTATPFGPVLNEFVLEHKSCEPSVNLDQLPAWDGAG
jgi:hypothetical protein